MIISGTELKQSMASSSATSSTPVTSPSSSPSSTTSSLAVASPSLSSSMGRVGIFHVDANIAGQAEQSALFPPEMPRGCHV